jgi:hypothetical protein
MEAKIPNISSTYADEGSLAHEFCSLQLMREFKGASDKDYFRALHELQRKDQYSPEMEEHANNYAEFVRSLVNENTRGLEIERNFRLDPYVPEARGTADCVLDNGDELIVIDFKYGRGVKVDATNNPQLLLYALGAMLDLGDYTRIKSIRACIVQPRVTAVPQQSGMSAESLLRWAQTTLAEKAQQAFEGEGELNPGVEQCRFCRAKGTCPGMAKEVFKQCDDILNDNNKQKAPCNLSTQEVADKLQHYDLIKQWFTAAEEVVRNALFNGERVSGFKLVEGRANRKINDERIAINRLEAAGWQKDKITVTKLDTLTNLERLVGKKNLPLILGDTLIRPEGQPSLVTANDPRPEFSPKAKILEAFDDVKSGKKINY